MIAAIVIPMIPLMGLIADCREAGLYPIPRENVFHVTVPYPTDGAPVTMMRMTLEVDVPCPGIPSQYAHIDSLRTTWGLPENWSNPRWAAQAFDALGRSGPTSVASEPVELEESN